MRLENSEEEVATRPGMAFDLEGRVIMWGRHNSQRRCLRPLPVEADSGLSSAQEFSERNFRKSASGR
ncbi:unnamed protein product [Dibothriocephalus latus]|uniref:Uncharacterized protein n=1 Tax=Dibothriocephalus latus TaxID=60516 RepID=A0A3P7PMJ1_DIBLA|nr:unnamed protein product [Dibothriocephalus latus]